MATDPQVTKLDWVAIYAAALGTINMVLYIIRYRQERRPLRVSASLRWDLQACGAEPVGVIRIANLGDSDVEVRSASVRFTRRGDLFELKGGLLAGGGTCLPCNVLGGHACELRVSALQIENLRLQARTRSVAVDVEDATGRHFRTWWRFAEHPYWVT